MRRHDDGSQSDIDAGIANVVAGFAPLKPAEFDDHHDPTVVREEARKSVMSLPILSS